MVAIPGRQGPSLPNGAPGPFAEWLGSFQDLIERQLDERTRYLLQTAAQRDVTAGPAGPVTTDYVNTIPVEQEPDFPGDEDIERRYRRWLRWNAAVMVQRAQASERYRLDEVNAGTTGNPGGDA